MLQISLPWILDVVASIDRLKEIDTGMKKSAAWLFCISAKHSIETIFDQSIYRTHLKISRERAQTLLQTLSTILPDNSKDDEVLSAFEKWSIHNQREQFRNVFFAELSVLPSFLVMEKEGYDIKVLIEEGEKLFPPSTLKKCPEADEDMKEVGKALAFELATACGFHIFRVTEAVLKRYWDHVSGGKKRPDLETIGSYAKTLESDELGDKKIWEALKQLANLQPQSAHPPRGYSYGRRGY